MNKVQLEMIEDVQCPGCINGSDTKCGAFKPHESNGCFHCLQWRPSTFLGGVGRLCLGLPKGFTRTGMVEFGDAKFSYIRMYEKPEDMPGYDKFNVAVWAMEKDGRLYVRCYSPRNNWLFVDVVKGGTLANAPGAINIAEFYDDMD